MKLLEYQGRLLFEKYNIPVKRGEVAYSPDEAFEIHKRLGLKEVVIKAQVPVGGRGKAGGIKISDSPEKTRKLTEEILSLTIKSIKVNKVLIAESVNIQKEMYVSLTLDRRTGKILLMAIREGGVEVEEIAKERPESIYTDYIPLMRGISAYQLRKFSDFLFPENKELKKESENILMNMFKLFRECYASLVEINPLGLCDDGKLWAIDSKIIIDDNALFKLPSFVPGRDMDYENIKEHEAKEHGLSYVKLEGKVGCVVNGAGLAMATMDTLKKFGGEPANFLDIGGSSSPEKVMAAMRILLSDANVKSVFLNIFGGITRCDDVAKGLVEAFKELNPKVPVVIRLTGTNEEEGRKIIESSGLNLYTAKTMDEGAKLACEMAEKM
ncbi:MAG: ADP-forming succinate--CoA ligase subunit beta [Candidatus Hydrothermales bacterium]